LFWRILLQGNKVPPEAEEHAAEYYLRGEYDRAQAVFKLLIECFKDYAEGYNYLGLIAWEQGKLDEALSLCDRLEKECRDDISAIWYRADIYMNTAFWQSAADAAIFVHKLYPSASLIAAFAFFELGRYEDALPHFIYGTLNYPRASRMLNGQRTLATKTSQESRDHNEGVALCRALHNFKMN
jgi:tetratricopeptide (TPR) repeat protein